MQINLVVVRPFGRYKRGDVVNIESEITSILSGEYAPNVVRVSQMQVPELAKGV